MRIRSSLAATAMAVGFLLLSNPGLKAQTCPGGLLDEQIQLGRAGAAAGNRVSLHCLGLALIENQQLDEARRHLQRLAAICPSSLGAANNLAIAMAGAGDHGAALAELGRIGDPDTMVGEPNAEVLRRNRATIRDIQRFWSDQESLAPADSVSLAVIDPIDSCFPDSPMPAAGPQDPATPVAVETTVAAAAEDDDSEEDDPIFDAVSDWVIAWEDQDVDGYLAAYSRRFVPPHGLSRGAWERQRRERIEAPQSITIELDEYDAEALSDTATLAEVEFVQTYESDTFRDKVNKKLLLTLENGAWKILSESASPAER